MARKLALYFFIFCVSGCSTLQSRETSSSVKYYNEPDSSSNRSKLLALPFYIIGAAAIVAGGLVIAGENGNQSDFENESGEEDALIATGLLIGGSLVWYLGDLIDGE